MLLTDPRARLVIAHRGGAGRAPENTLAALGGARGLGADAVELDVRLSRDGEVVIIHDPTLDRTTDASGPVHGYTARELAAVDAGARFTTDGGRTFPFRGRKVGVPRLVDVLEALPSDLPLLIETKEAAALEPTVRVLELAGAVDRAVVASADCAAVQPARGGALRTGACTGEGFRLLLGPPAGRLPYDAFCPPRTYCGIPLPMGLLAARALSGGAVTHVWTVNLPGQALTLWRAGVHGIVTDFPDVIARARSTLDAGP